MSAPNILLIVSDEHDPRYIRANGCSFIHTPSIDRLSSNGTLFDSAYTNSPTCVPARASLATGRYAHQTGYWDNCFGYDGRFPSWGHRLQAAGIGVESIGKLHFDSASADTGFDRQIDPMHIAGGLGPLWGAVRNPLPEKGRRSGLFDRVGAGESNYNRYDMATAASAVDWLEKRGRGGGDRPWVLQVGFVAPHMPLVVPQRYLDLYAPDTVPDPRLRPRDGYRRHPWVEAKARYWDHDAAFRDDDQRKLAIASYFGLISFLDDQVGAILDALESSGMADNTVVIYMSDHGDNLGARGLWNKGVFYDEAIKIPLILAGPGIEAGRRVKTNVSLVDIFPTVLDVMGVEPAEADADLPGASLLAIAAEDDDRSRAAFSEYHGIGSDTGGFMIASEGFKYCHYEGYEPELFDLTNDPGEEHNLAADPAYGEIRNSLERRLRSIVDPAQADRKAKQAQDVVINMHGGREAVLGLGNVGATPPPAKFSDTQRL